MKLKRLITILLISFVAMSPIACSMGHMGQTRYDLCQTPGIGLIMFVSNLCAFPPIIPDADISLLEPGVVLKTNFKVRVEKSYELILGFYFSTVQDRLNDNIIGFGYDRYCQSCLHDCNPSEIIEKDRKYYGKVISIRVIVRKLPDSTIILDRTFQTLCATGHDGKTRKDRDIGWISLPRGEFSIEVINILSQPELEGIETKIMLAAGHEK